MSHNYQLVILDISLSETDGLELLHFMRHRKDMPILASQRNYTIVNFENMLLDSRVLYFERNNRSQVLYAESKKCQWIFRCLQKFLRRRCGNKATAREQKPRLQACST